MTKLDHSRHRPARPGPLPFPARPARHEPRHLLHPRRLGHHQSARLGARQRWCRDRPSRPGRRPAFRQGPALRRELRRLLRRLARCGPARPGRSQRHGGQQAGLEGGALSDGAGGACRYRPAALLRRRYSRRFGLDRAGCAPRRPGPAGGHARRGGPDPGGARHARRATAASSFCPALMPNGRSSRPGASSPSEPI